MRPTAALLETADKSSACYIYVCCSKVCIKCMCVGASQKRADTVVVRGLLACFPWQALRTACMVCDAAGGFVYRKRGAKVCVSCCRAMQEAPSLAVGPHRYPLPHL